MIKSAEYLIRSAVAQTKQASSPADWWESLKVILGSMRGKKGGTVNALSSNSTLSGVKGLKIPERLGVRFDRSPARTIGQ